MSELISSNFVTPYFVKEIGEIGLTSKDIALALGITTEKVHKKIKRDKWTTIKQWKPTPYGFIQENNRLDTYYFFNTQGAKAFVARYSNTVGDAYLQFLFDCENITLNKVPLLLSTIDQLKKIIETKKVDSKKGTIVTKKVVTIMGLFEPIVEIIKDKCKLDELTTAERKQWAFEHRSSIAEGLIKKNNEEMRSAKIIPISITTRKQLEKKEFE